MGRVYVTGLGVVSSIGFGKTAFWNSLLEGRIGTTPVESFDTSTFDRHIGGEVKDFRPRDFLTAGEARRTGRCSAMALAAARMAVEDAKLNAPHLAGDRTAVIIGTTMGEANVISELNSAWIREGYDSVQTEKIPQYDSTLLPIHLARSFGATGMVQTLPAACAAGNYAIGFASDQIRAGRADVAITGASEIIEPLQYAGFVRLGAMAPERCQPFDKNRRGLILGEGAAILILESEEHLTARGGVPLAEIGGYGMACDAHHITRPHPDGIGSVISMQRAIASSGLSATDVDYVNAHGTGTPANDAIESKVMREVFGERNVPISSIKSSIGHCMGAASALESVACIMTIQTNIYPPTLGYDTPDPECEVNLIHTKPQTGKADVVLNNALAFGGYDAVVCFAKAGRLPELPKVST